MEGPRIRLSDCSEAGQYPTQRINSQPNSPAIPSTWTSIYFAEAARNRLRALDLLPTTGANNPPFTTSVIPLVSPPSVVDSTSHMAGSRAPESSRSESAQTTAGSVPQRSQPLLANLAWKTIQES